MSVRTQERPTKARIREVREQIEAARAGEQPPEAAAPGATVVRAKSSNQLRVLLAG